MKTKAVPCHAGLVFVISSLVAADLLWINLIFVFEGFFVLLSLFLKINLMEFLTGGWVRGYLKKHELLSSGYTTGKKLHPHNH